MSNIEFDYTKRLKDNMIKKNFNIEYIEECCKYAEKLLLKGLPVIFDKEHIHQILKLNDIDLNSYHQFLISSRHGGRIIESPSKKLKERQKWILKNILEKIKLPEYVHGFVKGKSILTNAKQHLNREEILCLDIKNFFSSINMKDVTKVFYGLEYTKEVAAFLSYICTSNTVLPTGAPTSPYLANLCFNKIDYELNKFSEENNLIYTRYADDITVSGNCSISKYKDDIIRIIVTNGFTINKEKTHIMTGNHRKMVTGLIVTDIVKIPKSFKKFLRQEIYYCNKFGVYQHLEMKKQKNSIINNNYCFITNMQDVNSKAINYKEYLYGKAYFIKMVEHEVGEKYLVQLDEIFGSTYDTNK